MPSSGRQVDSAVSFKRRFMGGESNACSRSYPPCRYRSLQRRRESDGRKMTLVLHPISLKDAARFVAMHHRHHRAPQGGLFAVGCAEIGNEQPCGVAIIGRPVARMNDDGWTAEVTRLCTTGERNACSMLYGAAWRACRALGYKRLITYILDSESGVSLGAAGWRLVGSAGGGQWSRPSRPRVDAHPQQKKLLFERVVAESAK